MATRLVCNECNKAVQMGKEWHISLDSPDNVYYLKDDGYYDFCSEQCLKGFMGTGQYNEQ